MFWDLNALADSDFYLELGQASTLLTINAPVAIMLLSYTCIDRKNLRSFLGKGTFRTCLSLFETFGSRDILQEQITNSSMIITHWKYFAIWNLSTVGTLTLKCASCGCGTHDFHYSVPVPESAKLQCWRRYRQQSVSELGLICGKSIWSKYKFRGNSSKRTPLFFRVARHIFRAVNRLESLNLSYTLGILPRRSYADFESAGPFHCQGNMGRPCLFVLRGSLRPLARISKRPPTFEISNANKSTAEMGGYYEVATDFER